LSETGNQLGYAGGAQAISAQELYPGLDPLLLQRKGRLILLATGDADRDALARLCREYYDSRSYDPIPTLVRSLAQVYRDQSGLAEHLPLAVILRGLELNMVGAGQAVVRLVRHGVVRDLFNAHAAQRGLRVAMTRQPVSPQIAPLYSAQWRLVAGDSLLITTLPAAERVGESNLRRILRLAGSANRVAGLLARLPRVPAGAPLIVMRQGRFSPVPEMPSATPPPHEEQQAQRQRRQGLSPIWFALLVALLAIVVTVWATGAHLEVEDLGEYLLMMFFPPSEPTPTLELATPEEPATPGAPLAYDAPTLIHPYPGARLEGQEIVLSWEWPDDLAGDEFFQVIVRPPGEEEARTLTRTRRHSVSIGAEGWYSWSVRIVDAADRDAPIPRSPEAEPVSFHWRAE
jgi:hypothetical protein